MYNPELTQQRRDLGLELNRVETDICNTKRALSELRQQEPTPLLEIEDAVALKRCLVVSRQALLVQLREVKLVQWPNGVGQCATWLQ